MAWYIIALFPAFFWSIGNVVDHFLARGIFKNSPFSFLVISCAFSIPVAAIIGAFQPQVFDQPLSVIIGLLIAGVVGFMGAWPYIIAVRNDGADNTTAILQTVPVFAYIIGLIFLGEELAPEKILGGVLAVLGAIAFTWNPLTKNIKRSSLLLMLFSAFIWACYASVIRYWAINVDWVTVTFWCYVSWSSFGLVGLMLFKKVRADFNEVMISKMAGLLMAALLVQQIAACIADLSQTKALSIAPTGVQVILFSGLQPVMVLFLCGLFHKFFPKDFEALRFDRGFWLRMVCVAVMLTGLYILIS